MFGADLSWCALVPTPFKALDLNLCHSITASCSLPQLLDAGCCTLFHRRVCVFTASLLKPPRTHFAHPPAIPGAAESAITPGFLLLISQYYTTNEHASRVLIWTVSDYLKPPPDAQSLMQPRSGYERRCEIFAAGCHCIVSSKIKGFAAFLGVLIYALGKHSLIT